MHASYKLYSRSRTNEQSFVSVYCVYFVSINNISIYRYVKCSIQYKGDGLQLTICVWYRWEMPLNTGLDASFYITCRTGEEYRRKQGKLMVQKLI
jgi:hypothetical protein